MWGYKRKKQNSVKRESLEDELQRARAEKHAFYENQLAEGQAAMQIIQSGHLSGDYLSARSDFGALKVDSYSVYGFILALAVQNAELQKRLEKLESKQ